MKKTPLTLALGLILAGPAAFALTAAEVVSDLQAQGYTRTEVRVGPNQLKAEAIRGTEKLEVIYDKATGAILKSEVQTVRAGEDTAPGSFIRDRDQDFAQDGSGAGASGDDESDDQGRGRGRDDASGDDKGGDRDQDRDQDRDRDHDDDRDDDSDDSDDSSDDDGGRDREGHDGDDD